MAEPTAPTLLSPFNQRKEKERQNKENVVEYGNDKRTIQAKHVSRRVISQNATAVFIATYKWQ
jgi:hypothetical protein